MPMFGPAVLEITYDIFIIIGNKSHCTIGPLMDLADRALMKSFTL